MDRNKQRKRSTSNKATPRRGKGAARGAKGGVASSVAQPPQAEAQDEIRLMAVIDVGSRALRMAVGEIAPERPVRRLEILNAPVSLGLDTFSSGRIHFSTTEAVLRTLHDFLVVLRGYGIEAGAVRAVATTAVRDARNREVFLDRIAQGCGLKIEVIEAIEETRLIYQFIRHLIGPRFDQGVCMLLSLGAGGTQIIVQRAGEIVFGETHHFGMLQLWGNRSSERSAIVAARSFLNREVRAIQRLQDLSDADSLFVINKELFLLLESMSRAEKSDAGLELQPRELRRLYEELDQLTTAEIHQNCGLDYPTVEMARMALEELKIFSDFTAVESITIPGASMLDSLLLDARFRLQPSGGVSQVAHQIESAACALGRKYHFDEAHARHVRSLALQIESALGEFSHISDHARLLLSVAALLHDIGYYVSFHSHELHSSYLISASEIMGLGRRDLERVAIVARYHRRDYGDMESPELQRFTPADKVELLKLAAVLRLADALDDDNCQRVARVTVELKSDDLRIMAQTRPGDRGDFSSIAQAFKEKADLFGDIFGIEPSLTEVMPR